MGLLRFARNFINMNFTQKFYDITNLIQQEFDRNSEKYGSKLQCRKGCSQCCSQIFRITLLDEYIIQEHIKSLPEERQIELKSKAEEYIKNLPLTKGEYPQGEGVETETGEDTERVNKGMRLPCPALGPEGECTIYEARPVICRRFGPPIYDYKNPGNVYACELNFSPGEEIIDDELIPNQTAIGMKWDELKEEYNEKTEQKVKYTTIAEAIAGIEIETL
jgi:Fe-S-cluster containining protein